MSGVATKSFSSADGAPASGLSKPLNHQEELESFLNDPNFVAALVKRTGTNRPFSPRDKLSFMREAMKLYFLGIEVSARGETVGSAKDSAGAGFKAFLHHGYTAARQAATSSNSDRRS